MTEPTNDKGVILRYRDGHTEHARLVDVDEATQTVSVEQDGAERTSIPFAELKAVFYPRVAGVEETPAVGGSTVAVEFEDGELIRGIAAYNPARHGFLLFPLDRSKSDRIFVVTSAILSIEVEKL